MSEVPSVFGAVLELRKHFWGGEGVAKCLQMLTWGRGVYQKCLRKHFESKFNQNWKKNIFNLLFHELFESISKCHLNTSYLYKRNIHGLSVNCFHKNHLKNYFPMQFLIYTIAKMYMISVLLNSIINCHQFL